MPLNISQQQQAASWLAHAVVVAFTIYNSYNIIHVWVSFK